MSECIRISKQTLRPWSFIVQAVARAAAKQVTGSIPEAPADTRRRLAACLGMQHRHALCLLALASASCLMTACCPLSMLSA